MKALTHVMHVLPLDLRTSICKRQNFYGSLLDWTIYCNVKQFLEGQPRVSYFSRISVQGSRESLLKTAAPHAKKRKYVTVGYQFCVSARTWENVGVVNIFSAA